MVICHGNYLRFSHAAWNSNISYSTDFLTELVQNTVAWMALSLDKDYLPADKDEQAKRSVCVGGEILTAKARDSDPESLSH